MAQYYYFNESGEKVGPIRGRDIQSLAAEGGISPETEIELPDGTSFPARKVKGLTFATPTTTTTPPAPQIPPPPPVSPQSHPSDGYFYLDANRQKQGPVNILQLQTLASRGLITPETRMKMESGRMGKAGQIPELDFTIRVPVPVPASVPVPAEPSPVPHAISAVSQPCRLDTVNAWYYYDAIGNKLGPIDSSSLKTLVRVGAITQDSIVETNTGIPIDVRLIRGLEFPLTLHSDLSSNQYQYVATTDVATHTQATGKNRIAAVLFAWFLGGVGGHKFYLGDFGTGITYLLFSWTLVPAILSLVDLISFLCMTDEAFESLAKKYSPAANSHTQATQSTATARKDEELKYGCLVFILVFIFVVLPIIITVVSLLWAASETDRIMDKSHQQTKELMRDAERQAQQETEKIMREFNKAMEDAKRYR